MAMATETGKLPLFPVFFHTHQQPVPRLPWLRPRVLSLCVSWVPPPPCLTVATDALDVRWGYQPDKGNQAYRGWMENMRSAHVILQDL